jgi:hypothetical protein
MLKYPFIEYVGSEFVSTGDVEVHHIRENYNYDISANVLDIGLRVCYVSGNSVYYRYDEKPKEPTAWGPLNKNYNLLFCRKDKIIRRIKRVYKMKKSRKLKHMLYLKIDKDCANLIVKYL